jgi:hypothetical protein
MKTFLAKLLGISKFLLDWLWPIFRDQTAAALETLLPAALKIVSGLAMDQGLSSEEKKAAAFSELKEIAIAQGITTGTSILNLAVELAVAKLKSK